MKHKLGPQAKAMLRAMGYSIISLRSIRACPMPDRVIVRGMRDSNMIIVRSSVRAAQSVPERVALCGDHRDCAGCINLADCCPKKYLLENQVPSVYADGGILFCRSCGTALGDADQDDTESQGVKV